MSFVKSVIRISIRPTNSCRTVSYLFALLTRLRSDLTIIARQSTCHAVKWYSALYYKFSSICSISAAQDILFQEQSLASADDKHLKTTYDNCLIWLGNEIKANERIRAAEDALPVLDRCSSCKVVRYCSRVSYSSCNPLKHNPSLSPLTVAVLVLLTESLETPPQSWMRDLFSTDIRDEVLRATVRLLLNRSAGVRVLLSRWWRWIKCRENAPRFDAAAAWLVSI